MLKQKIILSFSIKILLMLFQMVVTIFVARIAGATVLGTVAFATAYISMFLIFFDLGQGVAHVKLVSEGQNEKACNGVYVRIQLTMSLVFFLITILFYFINKYYFKKAFESSTHETVILITIFAISIANLFNIPRTIFIARTEQARSDLPDFIRQIIYHILRLIVVLAGYAAIAIAFSNLIATILIIPIYFYLIKGTQIGKWDTDLFKKYLFIALPVCFITFVETITIYVDKVFLQFFSNSTEVGYYVAGFSIGGLIAMVGNSAGLLLLPTFSNRLSENKIDEVNNMIKQYERFMWAFLFALTFIISLGSDLIVRFILGPKYSKSISILSIINLSYFCITYFSIYGVSLSSKGFFNLTAKLYFAKLIFLCVFAVFMLHPLLFNFGSKGLALTLLFSNIFIGVLCAIYSRHRISGIKIFQEKILIIFSLGFSIFSYIGYQFIDTILLKIIYLFGAFFSFYLIGSLLRIINMSDFRMLIQILSIRKMRLYIKGEMKNNID